MEPQEAEDSVIEEVPVAEAEIEEEEEVVAAAEAEPVVESVLVPKLSCNLTRDSKAFMS